MPRIATTDAQGAVSLASPDYFTARFNSGHKILDGHPYAYLKAGRMGLMEAGHMRVCRKLKALLRGLNECKGLFRITDSDGRPIGGVQVSCRVGDATWVPSGSSCAEVHAEVNYLQPASVFYRIGEPVEWRFRKAGYVERKITRYTADMGFNAGLDTIVLASSERFATVAGSSGCV